VLHFDFVKKADQVADIPTAAFYQAISDNGYTCFLDDHYPCIEVDERNCKYVSHSFDYGRTGLIADEHAFGLYRVWPYGTVYLSVAAINTAAAEAMLAELKRRAPRYDNTNPHELSVTFWSYSEQNGARSRTRTLEIPLWEEIRDNYTTGTRNALEKMQKSEFRPTKTGELYLWYGQPGTGKTTAIRALGGSWQDWCEVHYITDPDRFFETSADYMVEVLLHYHNDEKWRLFILEDAGELIQIDARQEVGQGLSRLLNMSDGLIGQGLKIMTLVSTNEELQKLHAAVVRPGRAAAQIEFDKFTTKEAQAWLSAHGQDGSRAGAFTLAELYDKVNNGQIVSAPRQSTIGFV